jgi:hypothetical protein
MAACGSGAFIRRRLLYERKTLALRKLRRFFADYKLPQRRAALRKLRTQTYIALVSAARNSYFRRKKTSVSGGFFSSIKFFIPFS